MHIANRTKLGINFNENACVLRIPPPHDYPYQIWEFCKEPYTRNTFWSCLIRCVNIKWIQLVLRKLQSGHDSVHRQMDRRTHNPLTVHQPGTVLQSRLSHVSLTPISCKLAQYSSIEWSGDTGGIVILYIFDLIWGVNWSYSSYMLSLAVEFDSKYKKNYFKKMHLKMWGRQIVDWCRHMGTELGAHWLTQWPVASLPYDTKPLPEPMLISEVLWHSPNGNFVTSQTQEASKLTHYKHVRQTCNFAIQPSSSTSLGIQFKEKIHIAKC